jgi:hypothetical protein
MSGHEAAEVMRFERTIHGFFGRILTQGGAGIEAAGDWYRRTCGPDQQFSRVEEVNPEVAAAFFDAAVSSDA